MSRDKFCAISPRYVFSHVCPRDELARHAQPAEEVQSWKFYYMSLHGAFIFIVLLPGTSSTAQR